MALHALKYSANVYIEARSVCLSKSFAGRHVLFYDTVSKQVKLVDTFLDTERCLEMIDFPPNVGSLFFYWLHDQTWHVMFTLHGFLFDKDIRQLHGNACMDMDKNEITLLNSQEIELQGRDLLYKFCLLDDGSLRYWIWIQRRCFESSRFINIYRCKLAGDERPERILSLNTDDFEEYLYVTMATVLGQNCCYFLKSFGTMYLQGGNSRTCFLEEFHCYDMENKKHQVRQTQPFPDLGEDLDNFSIGQCRLWHGKKLILLIQNDIWGKAVGNFMYNLLMFDADTLAWTKIELPIGNFSAQVKLAHLDSSAILTFRAQENQSNRYSFYRCPLKQPDKLKNLVWFKYKQLYGSCTSAAISDSLPKNFKSLIE